LPRLLRRRPHDREVGRGRPRQGPERLTGGRARPGCPSRRERETPALGAVRLAADGYGGLSITATTFDGTITTWLEAAAEGEVAVPLERLAALVRHFPADAEIAITADYRAATVTSGKARFKLPVLRIADLLERHALGEQTGCVELDAKIARDLFARPAFAASTEASRFYLKGICLHNAGDDLVAVTTDGFRLCRVTAPATTTLSLDRSLIIPNEMVKTIDRLLANTSGNVTLRRSERLFVVEGAGFALTTTRIDAIYPDYKRLIPCEGPNVVTVSRGVLSECLARFAAVAGPEIRTPIVSLRWNAEGLHVSADRSEDSLAADIEGEGETAVQIRYLAELIGALRGDNIRISVAEPGSMILVTGPEDENFFAGQMPIRPWSS
jgi:DNA polymerase-3 subunit beta